jgi:hypothetical protein
MLCRLFLPRINHQVTPIFSSNFHTTNFTQQSTIGGLKTQIQGIPTIEEIRRKHSAEKNAKEFKKEMANPDRIIGRAYAELEEERKYVIFILTLLYSRC